MKLRQKAVRRARKIVEHRDSPSHGLGLGLDPPSRSYENWACTRRLRRFDRAGWAKLPVEDFAQLSGESRDTNLGRWAVYSANPGIAFHSDWLSLDRIQPCVRRPAYGYELPPAYFRPTVPDRRPIGS